MLVDDWNDGLIYTCPQSDLKGRIDTSESALNAANSGRAPSSPSHLLKPKLNHSPMFFDKGYCILVFELRVFW
jgi:hypothetical protein